MGTFANPQIMSVTNQDRRRPRSLPFTMAGAVATPGDPVGANGTPTIWFKLVVPPDVSGILTIGPRLSAQQVDLGFGDFPGIGLYAHLWRQEGSGVAGLWTIDTNGSGVRPGDPLLGVRVNCEGHLQGRSEVWTEWAIRGGETYFLQVGASRYDGFTNVPVIVAGSVEWTFDRAVEPYEFTNNPSLPSCPGNPLTTKGDAIWYYDTVSGWPAWMKPGTKTIPHAPTLPAQGHMFAVSEVLEQDQVHTRSLLVGWTEASGPFFYGHLNPQHDYRTWTIDDSEIESIGAGTPDGQNHVGVYVDYHFAFNSHDEFRSNTGLATEPTTNWATGLARSNLFYGGPGRPNSIFASSQGTDFFLRELRFDGSLINAIPFPGGDFPITLSAISPDGVTFWGKGTTTSTSLNTRIFTYNSVTEVVTELPGVDGVYQNYQIVGVRPNNEMVLIDPTSPTVRLMSPTGVERILTLPDPPRKSTLWGASSFRSWYPQGITHDGQHLFISDFYPLDSLPRTVGGGYAGRRFVTDVYWVDLTSGVTTFKFRLGHVNHDTFDVFDTDWNYRGTTSALSETQVIDDAPDIVRVDGSSVTVMSPAYPVAPSGVTQPSTQEVRITQGDSK